MIQRRLEAGGAMRVKLGYDSGMGRLISATVAVFALVLIPGAFAQIHGVPPSVTSSGFGGHFSTSPGVPPSVTSLGPNGFQSGHSFHSTCCINPLFPSNPNPGFGRHHRSSFFPSGGGVYVPYAVPYDVEEYPQDDSMEEDYSGGPTIFDRRGPGRYESDIQEKYRARAPRGDRDEEESRPSAPAEAEPAAEQPQTVLVFRDGHTVEVQNYAILGNLVYDLTPGHPRKIALADLDLTATVKQNDDRGLDFRLPIDNQEN